MKTHSVTFCAFILFLSQLNLFSSLKLADDQAILNHNLVVDQISQINSTNNSTGTFNLDLKGATQSSVPPKPIAEPSNNNTIENSTPGNDITNSTNNTERNKEIKVEPAGDPDNHQSNNAPPQKDDQTDNKDGDNENGNGDGEEEPTNIDNATDDGYVWDFTEDDLKKKSNIRSDKSALVGSEVIDLDWENKALPKDEDKACDKAKFYVSQVSGIKGITGKFVSLSNKHSDEVQQIKQNLNNLRTPFYLKSSNETIKDTMPIENYEKALLSTSNKITDINDYFKNVSVTVLKKQTAHCVDIPPEPEEDETLVQIDQKYGRDLDLVNEKDISEESQIFVQKNTKDASIFVKTPTSFIQKKNLRR